MTRLILLGCVSEKHDHARPAKDLYCSTLWKKRRVYAEASGHPWLILSALHGVLHPEQPVEPYDQALGDLPRAERRAWSERVARELVAVGSFDGLTFEFHAGEHYQKDLVPLLEAGGATCVYPLAGLGVGKQLAWYSPTSVQQASTAKQLLDPAGRVRASEFAAQDRGPLDEAGLYSWWGDTEARRVIGAALGAPVGELLYVGLAGATKQPSGKRSNATLWKRIGSQHLKGRVLSSTFRLTLAALLEDELGLVTVNDKLDEGSRQALSDWMATHLSVRPLPWPDRDTLAAEESVVVRELDPPLNLDHVDGSTSQRLRLSALRKDLRRRLTE